MLIPLRCCNDDKLSRSAAAQLFMIQSGLISLEANTPHDEENHGATPHLLGITTLLIGGVRTLLDKPHMIRSKPLKTNGWIPKMTPCLKGDIFSKPSFLVSMLDFWGVNSVITRVASTTDRQTNENQQHPLRQKTTIAQLNIAWHNGKSDDNSHAVSAKKFDASLDLFRP